MSLLAPERFWEFSDALFEDSSSYYDTAVYNESRSETYKRLAKLAHASVGVDKEEFLKLVSVAPSASEPRNWGNAVASELKYFIKQGRQTGIHASPTVVVNGIIDSSIESSSTIDFWLEKAKSLDF